MRHCLHASYLISTRCQSDLAESACYGWFCPVIYPPSSEASQALNEEAEGYELEPGEGAGTAKAKDPKEEFLSQIISRLNEIFLMYELSEKYCVNFAHTVADKVSENERALMQLRTNTREQSMLGDFPKAVDDAVIGSSEANRNQMMQLLSNPDKAKEYSRLV